MKLFFLVLAGVLVAGGAHPCALPDLPGVKRLTPDQIFSLRDRVPQGKGLKLREFRADGARLWALMQTDSSDFAIVQTDLSGAFRYVTPLARGTRASGLTDVSGGVATVLFKEKQAVLAQYETDGRLLSEFPLRCTSAGDLVAIRGTPGVICPDGTIATHSTATQLRTYHSWARPGGLVESLGAMQLAIVDQMTGQVLLNDLEKGTITALTAETPELLEARKRNATAAAALQAAKPGQVVGRPLAVMDTASGSLDLFLLVYPYQKRDGPSVVRLSPSGQIVARYLCETPDGVEDSYHKIEVQNGFLYLASVSGKVFRYKI